jgi:hypothetical protein
MFVQVAPASAEYCQLPYSPVVHETAIPPTASASTSAQELAINSELTDRMYIRSVLSDENKIVGASFTLETEMLAVTVVDEYALAPPLKLVSPKFAEAVEALPLV